MGTTSFARYAMHVTVTLLDAGDSALGRIFGLARRLTGCMLLGMLLAGIAAGAVTSASAATRQEAPPATQGDSAKRAAPPARKMPDAPSADTPKNSGVVVVPPKTDSDAIATPPANVDPGIHSAQEGVDRKNKEKTEQKRK